MEHTSPDYSPLQLVKRRLYAMRNGVVADALRKAGCPRRLIFGVNLPQLTEIAKEFGPSRPLAETLWHDASLRESILLAPMLMPIDELSYDEALRRCRELEWHEEADILCFKLLRNAPFAPELAGDLCGADEPLMRYCGLRLWMNIVSAHPIQALEAAKTELSRPNPIFTLASMLQEEATFFLDN